MDDIGLAREQLDALHNLVESTGWKVLVAALNERYRLRDLALHRINDTPDLGSVRFVQGQLSEIQFLVSFPDLKIKELRAKVI